MKFDKKYPNAKIWDEPDPNIDAGIIKFSINESCVVCKETTCWMDICFEVAICSEECTKKLYDDWKNAYNSIANKYKLYKLN